MGQPVIVPVKDFQFIASLVEEKEKGRCEWVGVKNASDDTEESVKRFANIDGLAMKEYGDVGRECQHDWPCKV